MNRQSITIPASGKMTRDLYRDWLTQLTTRAEFPPLGNRKASRKVDLKLKYEVGE